MKRRNFNLVLVGLLLCPAALNAQTLSGDSEKKARDLLRELIESRERAKTAPAGQTPAPTVVLTSPPPVAVANPSPLTKPAPIVTKPAPETPNLAPTGANTRQPNYAELELLYLSGKITARQFQQFLRDNTAPPSAASASTQSLPPVYTKAPSPPLASPSPNLPTAKSPNVASTAPLTPAAPTSAPVEASPGSFTTPTEQTTLGDLEKKMDELLRLKAARDQAASVAATNSIDASKPKTKRDRMNELLKLYITGKVTETEYKARRDQLIAEPDPK